MYSVGGFVSTLCLGPHPLHRMPVTTILRAVPVPELEDSSKREIVETRNQLIKATNQMGLMVVELKELRRIVERHERLMRANSLTAYMLFVLVLSGAFWVAYRTKTDRLEAERSSLERSERQADEELARARERDNQRDQADRKAFELYQLLRAGKDKDALDRYPEVSKLLLGKLESEVLRDGIGRVRGESAHAAYMQGLASYEAGQWRRAGQDLRRSLQILEDAPWSASLRYHLGMALHRLDQHKEAAVELEAAIKLGGEGVGDDALFFLAASYDETRQRARAIAEYRQFVTRFPGHRLVPASRRRIAELSIR
jgi:TolA-binding protein